MIGETLIPTNTLSLQLAYFSLHNQSVEVYQNIQIVKFICFIAMNKTELHFLNNIYLKTMFTTLLQIVKKPSARIGKKVKTNFNEFLSFVDCSGGSVFAMIVFVLHVETY